MDNQTLILVVALVVMSLTREILHCVREYMQGRLATRAARANDRVRHDEQAALERMFEKFMKDASGVTRIHAQERMDRARCDASLTREEIRSEEEPQPQHIPVPDDGVPTENPDEARWQ